MPHEEGCKKTVHVVNVGQGFKETLFIHEISPPGRKVPPDVFETKFLPSFQETLDHPFILLTRDGTGHVEQTSAVF